MESLEQILERTLRKIKRLRRDLSAEVVMQKEIRHYEGEKGHWEDDGYRLVGGGTSVDKDYEAINERYIIDQSAGWIIDQPRIAKPDVQKREAARQELCLIYESSEYYSARYLAGKAIEISKNILAVQSCDWVLELVKQKDETKTIIKEFEVEHEEEVYDPVKGYYGGSSPGVVIDYEKRPVKAPTENAIKARNDLESLYKILGREDRYKISKLLNIPELNFLSDELLRGSKLSEYELRQIYNNSPNKWIKRQAGKALGYSKLKIWLHEHFR